MGSWPGQGETVGLASKATDTRARQASLRRWGTSPSPSQSVATSRTASEAAAISRSIVLASSSPSTRRYSFASFKVTRSAICAALVICFRLGSNNRFWRGSGFTARVPILDLAHLVGIEHIRFQRDLMCRPAGFRIAAKEAGQVKLQLIGAVRREHRPETFGLDLPCPRGEAEGREPEARLSQIGRAHV